MQVVYNKKLAYFTFRREIEANPGAPPRSAILAHISLRACALKAYVDADYKSHGGIAQECNYFRQTLSLTVRPNGFDLV